MGLGGCYSIMKYLVFIINLIFWLSGLAIIVLAVWLLTDPAFYISMPQDQLSYNISAYLLLGLGILLFIGGFFGCCGILMESPLLLVLFFCVLLIVLVAEVSAGIWGYSYKDELNDLIRRSVKDTVLFDYGKDDSRTKAFDSIQKELQCCGADGPEDWVSSNFKKLPLTLSSPEVEYSLPPSCCSTEDSADPRCINAVKPKPAAPIPDVIYKEGCTEKLLAELSTYLTWLIILVSILIISQLVGLVFSVSLVYSLQRGQRYKA